MVSDTPTTESGKSGNDSESTRQRQRRIADRRLAAAQDEGRLPPPTPLVSQTPEQPQVSARRGRQPDTATERYCTLCHQMLPHSAFGAIRARDKQILARRCRDCLRRQQREAYDRDAATLRQREYRAAKRKQQQQQ